MLAKRDIAATYGIWGESVFESDSVHPGWNVRQRLQNQDGAAYHPGTSIEALK